MYHVAFAVSLGLFPFFLSFLFLLACGSISRWIIVITYGCDLNGEF
jgi:hypothetical protein